MNLVGNLNSIADQITQVCAGGADAGEPEAEPIAEMEDDAMVEKIMKFLKQDETEEETVEMAEDEEGSEVEKAEDGATASDDAEERIEDQPEENLDNIQEVAKAIAKALKKDSVKKSKKVNPLSKEIESIRKENRDMKKALEGIFEGLGIADEIKKSQEIEQAEKKKVPMNDANEIQKTLDFIKKGLSPQEETFKNARPDNSDFRKSLIDNDGQLLRGIFRKSAG